MVDPILQWTGKRTHVLFPQISTNLVEIYGDSPPNSIFWGDNLGILGHLKESHSGMVQMVYIDPPYESDADYKRLIRSRDGSIISESTEFTDRWGEGEYLQYMYDRIIVLRDLLADSGVLYLHCDWRASHRLRCVLDEVFGPDNFSASLVWSFQTRSSNKSTWKKTHNDILMYKKGGSPPFHWDHPEVIEPLSPSTIEKYRHQDDQGKYRLCGRNLKGSHLKGAKDVDPAFERTHPELVIRDYLRPGKVPGDCLRIDIENQNSPERTGGYPTQKPRALLRKLILASTDPGDLILDCFMGSGTTLVEAHAQGRRFVGVDSNKGAVETSIQRLTREGAQFCVHHPIPHQHAGAIEVACVGGYLEIKGVHTMASNWRNFVDMIAIDFQYDGQVFRPSLKDVPNHKDVVAGSYHIPVDAKTIKIKITDVHSQTFETVISPKHSPVMWPFF